MRRLMAAAALAVLCATSAACSDSGESPNASASGGSAAASAAATSAAAGSGNTEQICADAQKVITDATTKFGQELSKILANASKSSDADTVKPIKALFTEWADGLRELAGRADDEQLKSALNDTAEQIGKVANSIKSASDLQQADKLLDTPEVQAAEKKFETFCG